MDPKHSTPRPTASAHRPQTVSSSSQGEEASSHKRLEQLLPASTTGQHNLRLQELGSEVHKVISKKNLGWLKNLVHRDNAALEEVNEQGLRPLYNAVYSNWPEGALLLLEQGADVQKAESIPQNLCYSHKPLIHMALKTGNQELAGELIKRGASIRVRDFKGKSCVKFHRFSSPEVLFHCLTSSVMEEGSRRTDLVKDLLFVVSTAAWLKVTHQQVEEFITSQPSCHQSKMFEVFAACLWIANRDESSALCYWRKSAKCQPHDHTVEEEMASRSVFADIIKIKEYPLPDTVTTDDDKLAIRIHALLAAEKYMPEDRMLHEAGGDVHYILTVQRKILTIVGFFCRLTTIRLLHRHEVEEVIRLLRMGMENPEDLTFPISSVMDSIKTIKNCLLSLNDSCSKSQLSGAPLYEDSLNLTLRDLFHVLLQTMKCCYCQEVQATTQQLQEFTYHIKDILKQFPSCHCQDAFHLLAQNEFDRREMSENDWPITVSVIKNLVTYSAKVRGKVCHKNSPLHLLSDKRGDTPLHCLARHWSQKHLVQEGVLQCFLDHGADLCTRNNRGETVRSILVRRGVCTESELLPSLKCLAAAACMRIGRLRQTIENCLPAAVRNFVLDH